MASEARKHLNKFLKKHIEMFSGNLIDVGCGDQKYKKVFTNCKYTGIDKRFGIDVDILEGIPGKYDCFICLQVLEHLEDPIKALKNIYDCLKYEGIGIVCVPIKYKPHMMPNDFYRFTRSFPIILEYVGFKLLDKSIFEGKDVNICCLVKK